MPSTWILSWFAYFLLLMLYEDFYFISCKNKLQILHLCVNALVSSIILLENSRREQEDFDGPSCATF